MAYEAMPHTMLQWGDPGNPQDYRSSNRGQWFLGVLDTRQKKVFMLPSDLEPPDKYIKQAIQREGTYISKPQPGIAAGGWRSRPMAATSHRGINSPAGGPNEQGGLRQHGRVVRAYGCIEGDCLGFAVIKMTDALGEFRDRSNSLNSSPEKLGQNPRMSPSGRSHRMPEQWSKVLKRWLEHQLQVRLQDSLMP